jgi:large subunit ribosomal protein L4
MKLKSYKKGSVGEVSFDAAPFGTKLLYRTLKDAVDMYETNQRQGTASTKGRAEVAGSNKKPWPQKHTGRARAGDRKSPIWRGGGTVFGPKPRDYSYHMPKKARRVALRSALSGKLADGEVVVADFSSFAAPSAKEARALLAAVGAPRRAVIVLSEKNETVWKSFRNFPRVSVCTAADLSAYDALAGGVLVMEKAALELLAQRVGTSETGGAS